MQKLLDKTKGAVDITITGAYPEELINRLAADTIPFWGLTKIDPLTFELSMFARDYKTIRPMAKRAMCRIHIRRKRGLPFKLKRLRKRGVLIAGAAISVAAALILPLFIWNIQVEGNERVSDREIIRALDEVGIGIGTFGCGINPVLTETKMLLKIPELSYLTVNIRGGRANVVVREDIPAPEVTDESVVTDLVASHTGVITKMEVLRGKSLTEEGQTVVKGDKLVSGVIEHYAYERLLKIQTVRSLGEIYARTWSQENAVLPLEYEQKRLTGRETAKYSLILGSKRINLYFNSGNSYDKCVKIIRKEYLTLPGGIQFPLAFEKVTEKECVSSAVTMDQQTAETELKAFLEGYVGDRLGAGRILHSQFNTRVADGLITVTADFECERQIAVEVMARVPGLPENEPQQRKE